MSAPPAIALEIRSAAHEEVRAGRMLLPEAFAGGKAPDLLLAVQNDPLRFIGAAAFWQVAVAGGIGWNVMLHVVAAHRRRGIGSQLIADLAERGRCRRLSALLVNHDVDREPVAGPFLQSIGFRFAGRESRAEVDLQHYIDVFVPMQDRLMRRGKVPASVRAVALAEAPRDEVLRFFAKHKGSAEDDAEARWPREWDGQAFRDASLVLMDGSRAIGLWIGAADRSRVVAHYRLVGADRRGGWANLVLCAEAARRYQSRGIQQIEFVSTAQTRDTEAVVNLHGHTPICSRDRYLLPLNPRPKSGDE